MVPLFPKGEGVCTRLPILVEMRNGPHRTPSLFTMERQANGPDTQTEVPANFENEDNHEKAVERIMLEAIGCEHQKIAGISATTYLRLTLSGPHLPNLDLLDLPGLVVNQDANEPDSMPEDTHALVDAIIEDTRGRAVFLAVRLIGETAKC